MDRSGHPHAFSAVKSLRKLLNRKLRGCRSKFRPGGWIWRKYCNSAGGGTRTANWKSLQSSRYKKWTAVIALVVLEESVIDGKRILLKSDTVYSGRTLTTVCFICFNDGDRVSDQTARCHNEGDGNVCNHRIENFKTRVVWGCSRTRCREGNLKLKKRALMKNGKKYIHKIQNFYPFLTNVSYNYQWKQVSPYNLSGRPWGVI